MILIGKWAFDPRTRRLLCGRDERRLSPKAADVLKALAETPQRVWSRDALLERVWPNVIVGEEVLTHAIAEVRIALGDDFRSPVFVETIYKRGYRLLCDVEHPDDMFDHPPVGEFDLPIYARYIEACDLFDRGGTRNTGGAAAMFGVIAATDPDFAPARVGLAKALALLNVYDSPRSGDLGNALAHCEAARKSDPSSADAFAVQGFVYAVGRKYRRARRFFRIAVGLNPRSSGVHYLLGRACFSELDFELAGPMLERAAALRAGDYHSLVLAGKARQMRGQVDLARADFARAAARIRPHLEAWPDDCRAIGGLARCLVQLGRLDEAFALVDLVGKDSDQNYLLACTLARAGETRRAFDALERALDDGYNHRTWLERDPDFCNLHGDRRFRRIVESIEPR